MMRRRSFLSLLAGSVLACMEWVYCPVLLAYGACDDTFVLFSTVLSPDGSFRAFVDGEEIPVGSCPNQHASFPSEISIRTGWAVKT